MQTKNCVSYKHVPMTVVTSNFDTSSNDTCIKLNYWKES